MEVLSAALTNEAREAFVRVDVLPHLSPQPVESTADTKYQNLVVGFKYFTYGTDPVKLIPARWGEAVIVSPKTGPSAGMKLTTPGGRPASRQIL